MLDSLREPKLKIGVQLHNIFKQTHQYCTSHLVFDLGTVCSTFILLFADSCLTLCGFSGFAVDNIIKVLHGKRIGTLFHRDANELDPAIDASACEMAVAARECSRRLQVSSLLGMFLE